MGRINKRIAKKNINHNHQLVIFSFDHIGLSINLDGRYENSELELLEQFITKNAKSYKETAVDIGANIGNHSIFLSNFLKFMHLSLIQLRLMFVILRIKFSSKYLSFKYWIGDENTQLPFVINPNNIGGSKMCQRMII